MSTNVKNETTKGAKKKITTTKRNNTKTGTNMKGSNESAILVAYSAGYMAGILRLKSSKCPFSRKGVNQTSWLKGQSKGTEVVQYHKKALRHNFSS